jgi:hypothetical protein
MVRPRHRIGDRFVDPQEKAEAEESAAAPLSPWHVGLHNEHLDIPSRQHDATPNPQTDKSSYEEELNPIIPTTTVIDRIVLTDLICSVKVEKIPETEGDHVTRFSPRGIHV